jgi:hypothetical protein
VGGIQGCAGISSPHVDTAIIMPSLDQYVNIAKHCQHVWQLRGLGLIVNEDYASTRNVTQTNRHNVGRVEQTRRRMATKLVPKTLTFVITRHTTFVIKNGYTAKSPRAESRGRSWESYPR